MVIYEPTEGRQGASQNREEHVMEYSRVEGEVLDYLSGWEGEFDVDAIMDAIRDENPDATTIDDIDQDAFAYIIESNAL